jgi:hypothetical protein
VRDPRHNYVAAIGCDVHNYQRYCVRLRPQDDCPPGEKQDERQIQYVVAGGSGAYLGATHKIDKIDMRHGKTKDFPAADVYPITERDFRCYPLRGDSIAYYSRSFGKYVRWRGLLSLLAPITVIASYFGLQEIEWNAVSNFFLSGVQPGDRIEAGNDSIVGWHAALGSLGTLVVAGVLGLLVAAVAAVAPRGYRTFSSLTLATAAVLAGLWLVAGVWWWEDLWKVAVVTLGVVVVPVIATLIGYYYRGVGPRLTADLLIASTGITVVALLADLGPRGGAASLIWVAAMLGALVASTILLGVIRRMFTAAGQARIYRWLIIALMAAGAIALWVKWNSWIFPTVLIAVGVIVTIALLALFVIIWISGGLPALFHRGGLGGKGIDPDEAVREVANRYDIDPDATPHVPRYSVASSISPQTRRIVDFLLTEPGKKRRLLDKVVSELGDWNKTPFFKSFLRLNVRESTGSAAELEIKCYGVTGWEVDAKNPPLEDCVRIPLEPLDAPETAPGEDVSEQPERGAPIHAA